MAKNKITFLFLSALVFMLSLYYLKGTPNQKSYSMTFTPPLMWEFRGRDSHIFPAAEIYKILTPLHGDAYEIDFVTFPRYMSPHLIKVIFQSQNIDKGIQSIQEKILSLDRIAKARYNESSKQTYWIRRSKIYSFQEEPKISLANYSVYYFAAVVLLYFMLFNLPTVKDRAFLIFTLCISLLAMGATIVNLTRGLPIFYQANLTIPKHFYNPYDQRYIHPEDLGYFLTGKSDGNTRITSFVAEENQKKLSLLFKVFDSSAPPTTKDIDALVAQFLQASQKSSEDFFKICLQRKDTYDIEVIALPSLNEKVKFVQIFLLFFSIILAFVASLGLKKKTRILK